MTDGGPRETRHTTIDREAEHTELTEQATGNGAAPSSEDAAEIAAERDAYLDQLQRSRAEFANFRRRTEQERGQIRAIANQGLVAQFLPVLDDLRRALAAVPDAEREAALPKGVALIERKFWGVLERAGVAPFEALGRPFDPAEHEAVESVPGTAADTVVGVYQEGYRLGANLLRPAMVKVGDRDPVDGAETPADGAPTLDS